MRASFLLMLLLLTACGAEPPAPLLPPPNFKGQPAQGQEIYQAHCARCHGVDLRGDPRQGPPLLNEIYHPSHHADLAFYQAVRNGSVQHHWHFGNMPAVSGVTPEMVGHVVAYVRAEQRRAGIF